MEKGEGGVEADVMWPVATGAKVIYCPIKKEIAQECHVLWPNRRTDINSFGGKKFSS